MHFIHVITGILTLLSGYYFERILTVFVSGSFGSMFLVTFSDDCHSLVFLRKGHGNLVLT